MSATMAWKELDASSGMMKLDFSHPRVIAAMKLTGIQEADLTSSSPPLRQALSARLAITDPAADDKSGASTARADTLARSKDFWERRKGRLLQELEQTADALEESDVEEVLETADVEDEKLNKSHDQEKNRVDMIQGRNMSQLQREARRATQAMSAQADGSQKKEEQEKRLKDVADEKRAQMRLEADKRKEKLMKAQEKVKEEKKRTWQGQRDKLAKQKAKDEQVAQRFNDKEKAIAEKTQENTERRAQLSERQTEHEQKEFAAKVQQYKDSKTRHQDVEDRLVQKRLEKDQEIEERKIKFSEKIETAVQKQLDEDEKRKNTFLENSKKIEEARKKYVETEKEKLANIKMNRDKTMTRWTQNKQACQVARKERHFRIKNNVAESLSKASESREQYYEEMVIAKAGNRGMFLDVVEQNKARIDRSLEHAHRQTLSKIEKDAARRETNKLQNEQMQVIKGQVIQKFMLGRQRVEELRRIDPAKGETSKRRANEVLRFLDMPEEYSRTAKEGEEGEQK